MAKRLTYFVGFGLTSLALGLAALLPVKNEVVRTEKYRIGNIYSSPIGYYSAVDPNVGIEATGLQEQYYSPYFIRDSGSQLGLVEHGDTLILQEIKEKSLLGVEHHRKIQIKIVKLDGRIITGESNDSEP